MFQESLLHATPEQETATRRIVLSTSYHVFPLFTRGCLIAFPQSDHRDTSHRPAVLGLVEVEGPVPKNWIAALEDSGRNAVPVLLELKPGRAVRRENTEYGLVSALAIDDVQTVLFRSVDELRRFRSWPFEDLDVTTAKLEWGSAPELFADAESDLPRDPHGEVEQDVLVAIESRVRRTDMFLGYFASLVSSVQDDASSVEVVTRLLNMDLKYPRNEDVPPRLLAALTAGSTLIMGVDYDSRSSGTPSADMLILRATCHALVQYSTRQGWPSKEVLDNIYVCARDLIEKWDLASAQAQLETWYQFCRSAIDDPSKYPLGDSGSLIRRAVLLLLLRGSLEGVGVDAGKSDAYVVGPRVRQLAMDLAALRTGLSALPSRMKGPGASDPGQMLAWLGRACISLALGGGTLPEQGERAVATYVDSTNFLGRWRFSSGATVLFEVPADLLLGLRKVAEDCRYYGYSVEASDPRTLVVAGGPVEPLACPVEVTLIRGQSRTDDEVRFKAKIVSLAPTDGGGVRASRESTAMKKVTKNYLWSLLTANVAQVHYCRVGIEPDTANLVVLVDQLLSTMDRDECIAHLRNVSNVATHFEV